MRFDWDQAKAAENVAKHGIAFESAIEAFDDPHALYISDEAHSDDERREKLIGATDDRGILFIIFTERREDMIRIISARQATPRETRLYAENKAAY